nr:reverse transcriptase domain-containing protein [Tanacetum cinerariifolium]
MSSPLAHTVPKTITPTDRAKDSSVITPLHDDPYMLVKQAYIPIATDTKFEPFEDPIKTEETQPLSPRAAPLSPDYTLTSPDYTLHTPRIDEDTARMAVHTRSTKSLSIYSRVTEVMALSPLSYCKRDKSFYETPSSYLPLRKRCQGISKLLLDTETEGDESEAEGTGSESEELKDEATISVDKDEFIEVGEELELHGSILQDDTQCLDALPPTLLEGMGWNITKLYDRSATVRGKIHSQRFRLRSLEQGHEQANITFGTDIARITRKEPKQEKTNTRTEEYTRAGGNPTSTSEPIIFDSFLSLTSFEGSDFILEDIEAYLKDESISLKIDHVNCDQEGDICLIEKLLNDDPFQLPPMDLKQGEVVKAKSLIEEPLKLELKDLPSHLVYAYLEGADKLPVIIAKDLKVNEKEALLKVFKSHKRAIAWKITYIKGIDPRFCTHKILMEEDYKLVVQSQRRVTSKIHVVIKKEVIKLLDAGMIYPISDSSW